MWTWYVYMCNVLVLVIITGPCTGARVATPSSTIYTYRERVWMLTNQVKQTDTRSPLSKSMKTHMSPLNINFCMTYKQLWLRLNTLVCLCYSLFERNRTFLSQCTSNGHFPGDLALSGYQLLVNYYYYYFVFIWIARSLDHHFGWELHFVVFGLLIKSLCGIFVKFLHYVCYFVGCVS